MHAEIGNRIPGSIEDRKTPLGELNWIFTAITDTIAWSVLPQDLFQKLFRQDLLVASLFRSFLLADRIMRSASCTPMSIPALPETHQHPLWQSWDLALEGCILQMGTELLPLNPALSKPAYDVVGDEDGGGGGNVPGGTNTAKYPSTTELRQNTSNTGVTASSGGEAGVDGEAGGSSANANQDSGGASGSLEKVDFFQEQLTAFEVWLQFGGRNKRSPPLQLPIVLQVRTST
jgi:regulator-associated protein of mTOR